MCGSRGVFRLGETPRFDGDKNRETKKSNRYARVGKKLTEFELSVCFGENAAYFILSELFDRANRWLIPDLRHHARARGGDELKRKSDCVIALIISHLWGLNVTDGEQWNLLTVIINTDSGSYKMYIFQTTVHTRLDAMRAVSFKRDLNSARVGTNRYCELVLALKTFLIQRKRTAYNNMTFTF